jgi:hypothetical protein
MFNVGVSDPDFGRVPGTGYDVWRVDAQKPGRVAVVEGQRCPRCVDARMWERSPELGNHSVHETVDAADLASMSGTDRVSRQWRAGHTRHHNDRGVAGVKVDRLRSDTGTRECDEGFPLVLGCVAAGGLEDLDDKVRVIECDDGFPLEL